MQRIDYCEVLDALPNLVWSTGPDGVGEYYNHRFQEYAGLSREALQGWSWAEIVHPDDRQRTIDAWTEAFSSGTEYYIEYRLRRARDGAYRWHAGSATPLRDAAGRIVRWVGSCTDIDERKRTEERLGASEEKFRTLHESLRDAFVSVTMDGRIMEFNSAYLELLGYTAEEVRSKSYTDLTPEKWHAIEAAIVAEQILPLGYSEVYEKEYRRKDGTLVPIELRTVLLRDAAGQPERMWAAIRDISARKSIEFDLAESRRLLERERDVLRALMDGAKMSHLVYLDRDFNFLHVNETYAKTCGYRPEEMIGKNHFVLYPNAENEAIFTRVRDTGEAFAVYDRPFEYPDDPGRGLTYWDWTLTAARDAAGNIVGLVLSLFETTMRKQAEEALRVSEELFSKAFHRGPMLMSISEIDTGRYVEVNAAFTRVSGFTREEAIGHTSVELGWISPELRQMLFESIREKGCLPATELELTNKDGRKIWCHYAGEVVETGGGRMLLSIAQDITARKQAEAAFAKAKAAAEAANRAKSEFLANMSHEIRTPITGVMGMTELLADTELDSGQRHYLETIQSSSEDLLALVNDVLDLAKIEAGEVTVEAEDFSVRDLVAAAIGNQLPLADLKGVALRSVVPEAVPDRLQGDALRLKQVLLNLLGNAVKFTPSGEVVVTVGVDGPRDNGMWLEFAVADTGIGIRAEFLEKIFAPFQQADSSISKGYGGTGLGLAICSRLVALMGGTIGVESRAGIGSTFRVRLPLAAGSAGGEATASGVPLQLSPRDGNNHSLLLVEDNDAVRMFFVEVLEKHGYRVDVALNGAEALDRWEERNYDLILMDIQMPVMDGLAALREIRARERQSGRRTQIAAITAHAMEEDRLSMLAQGFDDYLAKPARVRGVLEVVERCLATGRPDA